VSGAGDLIVVGRDAEIAVLAEAVRAVVAGWGGQVWIEGEAGIGKSALLAAGLADAGGSGCQVFWAAADERGQQFPLRAILHCLRVTRQSDDPERREIVEFLGGGGGVASLDLVPAAVERLLALVDRLAVTPAVLVLDDLHWADDASVVVWQELSRAVRQSPLLLVAACRLTPPRAGVAALRRHAVAQGAVMVGLEPLPPQPVAELVRHLLGAEAVGPRLVDAVAEAGGNPLYVRELIAALARERRLGKDGGAMELPGTAAAGVPASLAALISDRLRVVSPGTRDVLRAAAMLGADVSATDLTVVLGRPVTELWPAVAEALAAGVLVETGPRLAFRHPLIGQVLYDSTPAEVWAALHRQAAEALAGAGAAVDRVAEQLLAAVSGPGAAGTVDRWVLDWLAGPGLALSYRSPQVAAELFGRAAEHAAADDPRREELQAARVSVLVNTGRREEAVELAEEVLAATHDPARAAEMSFWLARALHLLMRQEQARGVLVEALRAGGEHGVWTARVLALLSLVTGQGGGGFDQEIPAREALAAAERAGDRYAAGMASDVITMSLYFRGDLAGALAVLDRTLAMPGDDPETADVRLAAMGNRIVTLHLLDRLVEANEATQAYLAAAERYATPNRLAGLRCTAAQYYYPVGLWDEALVELEAVADSGFPLAPRRRLQAHGVLALIAAHRDDEATATTHLAALDGEHEQAGLAALYRQHQTLARAVLAERAGQPEQALALLGRRGPVTTEHYRDYRETLPSLTRLALAAGDTDTASWAADQASAQAAAHPIGSWLALAGHCRGLIDADPAPLLDAAETYRRVGRRVDLGMVLEDAAVLLAERGDPTAARAAVAEAAEQYLALGAHWDLRRADARLRPHGIRRGRRRAQHAATGWDALSATERKVAALVAEGLANPDIAGRLFLSRRTVEAHVSRILGKLEARSRVEIIRAAAAAHAPTK